MKLVVIYGPPAVGKLTTAEKLGAITDLMVFHSHLAIDLVNSITPEDSGKEYSAFLFKIIYETVEFAWQKKQPGLIMTIAYTGSEGQKTLLQKLKALMESDGGVIYFVRLRASIEELKKRVVDPSRDFHGKLMDPEELERWMAKINYLPEVDMGEVLDIDNTNLSADSVAETINKRFKLSARVPPSK